MVRPQNEGAASAVHAAPQGAPGSHAAHGAYQRDAHGAYQEAAEPQGPPNVYLPYAEQSAQYEEFTDPATAHGWQTAYDETQELPPTPAEERNASHGPRLGESGGGLHAKRDRSVFVDGSGRRRRLVRPIAIAAGAACVLFLAVVVAGLFNSGPSGSPLPWVHDKGERAKPKQRAGQVASPTPAEDPSSSAGSTGPAVPSSPSHGSEAESPTAGAQKSGSPTGGGETSTAPATTAPDTEPASSATAPGRGRTIDNPGHGRGPTKGPN